MTYLNGLIEFIENSSISFLAIQEISNKLKHNGYIQLSENKPFNLVKGGKYFITRNNSTIIAFDIGEKVSKDYGFHIVSSHCDSPCFKVKPICDLKSDIYQKVLVEPYGGLICPSWLDRPLSIAGRVLIREQNKIVTKIIDLKEDLLMIPNVCIHFNRDINKGYSYDFATDMQPLLTQEVEGNPIIDLLSKHLKINSEDIINFDLYLYNNQKASIWGLNKEYVSAPRLDDLECVYTSLESLIQSHNDKDINVVYVADNEEVGSMSRQGADSDFLISVLSQIHSSLEFDIPFSVAIANSFMISADNAHAVHPNQTQLTDVVNKVYMNKGIVIKFNASQSYTSDSFSSAIFQELCRNCGVPYQIFTNKSNIRGGSTLGNIALSHLSLKTVDIGLAQLAMHSSYETAGVKDIDYVIEVFKNFYNKRIIIDENSFILK